MITVLLTITNAESPLFLWKKNYMTFYFNWHLQNERFTCKAFIVDYDLFKGWWCESCPDCNKPLSGLPNNLRCMKHNYPTSTPVPWFNYHAYQNNLTFSVETCINPCFYFFINWNTFSCLLGSELIASSAMVKMSQTFFSPAKQLSIFSMLQLIIWCSTKNSLTHLLFHLKWLRN